MLTCGYDLRFWINLPLRVPDLRRFVCGAEFGALHDAVAVWADRHFELVEGNAPWLRPAGRDIADSCRTEKHFRRELGEPFNIRYSGMPWVQCERRVAAVYGFSGPPTERLVGLKAALTRIGWSGWPGMFPPEDTGHVGGPRSWNPVPELAVPPVFRFNPHTSWASPAPVRSLYLDWFGRGDVRELEAASCRHAGRDPRAATRLYEPVEVTGPAFTFYTLAAKALADYENAVCIGVTTHYYWNTDTNARPHRLRRYPRPVWWAS